MLGGLFWKTLRLIKYVCVCVCVRSLLCPALSESMDRSPPGSSVHRSPRKEYWSGLPFPSPGDLPDPGIETMSLASPALAGGFFTSSTAHTSLLFKVQI